MTGSLVGCIVARAFYDARKGRVRMNKWLVFDVRWGGVATTCTCKQTATQPVAIWFTSYLSG